MSERAFFVQHVFVESLRVCVHGLSAYNFIVIVIGVFSVQTIANMRRYGYRLCRGPAKG